MECRIQLICIAFVFCQCALAFSGGKAKVFGPHSSMEAEKIKRSLSMGDLTPGPAGFTENKGQVQGWDGAAHPEVKFTFQEGSTQIFLLEKGIAYQFTRMHYPDSYNDALAGEKGLEAIGKMQALQQQVSTETFRMDMT